MSRPKPSSPNTLPYLRPENPAFPAINPRPFKPRPKLFAGLLVIFAAWVAWLIYLYFTTVHK